MDDMQPTVDVVYALPDKQHIFQVDLFAFANQDAITILDVIRHSGILEYYDQIDLAVNKVGIYGEIKQLSDFVKPLDRVEIYRELIVDPMEARRLRAKKQRN